MPCQCQQPIPDLSEASLEQLGTIKVYTASRHLQQTADAPSSVTIITADEIQCYGYNTLADALTETMLLSDVRMTLQVLQELKRMGVRISMEDFGTGYSSLSYLSHFPVDKLKVDRAFIQNATVNRDDAAVTTAIVNLAKSLNLKVIAEGVENETQLSFLRELRCDEIQGFYFGRPLTADQLIENYARGPVVENLLHT